MDPHSTKYYHFTHKHSRGYHRLPRVLTQKPHHHLNKPLSRDQRRSCEILATPVFMIMEPVGLAKMRVMRISISFQPAGIEGHRRLGFFPHPLHHRKRPSESINSPVAVIERSDIPPWLSILK